MTSVTVGVDRALDDFAAARPRLLGIAYRMLGTMVEAEDVVGDVAERWWSTDRAAVSQPEAWLVAVTARRAMDVLRSARRQRERYRGEWLPEPVADDDLPPVESERRDTLGLGFLVLVERLTPLERAVLVLHDGFGYRHREIAEALGRTPSACRQTLSRARRQVAGAPQPTRAADSTARAVVERFLDAVAAGDVSVALASLSPDVVLRSDGGGVVHAAMRPVRGARAVSRLLINLAKRTPADRVIPLAVNGVPGILLASGARRAVLAFDVVGETIAGAYVIVAPAKLAGITGRHLGDQQ